MPNLPEPSPKSLKKGRLHFVVFGLYTFLSLILTWPLVAHITTQVPGIAQWAFDESTFIWNVWYLKHTLVDHLSNPLHTELIWYPLGIDLVLYTYNFFHALFAQPLALAVNLPFGSNVALLGSTILSAYGTFLLVRYLFTRTEQALASPHLSATHPAFACSMQCAAFVAGLLYAFASNRAIYAALGHYDMVTTQWIPFYALLLLRSLDSALSVRQRRKAAALAGLFFAFNGLAEMITAVFLAIFTLIVVVVYVTKKTDGEGSLRIGDWRLQSIANLQSLSASLLLTGIVGFLIWSPVLVPILHQFLTNDFSLKGWGEAIPLSTDLLGWFTPTVLHPLFGGDLIHNLRQVQLRALATELTGFRDVNTVFLGWASLALALVGAWTQRRQGRIWLWTCVIFGLFTLGPFLQINGRYRFDLDGVEATFPLPYALLHYLPIIKANRAPNRNSVVLMLGVAVLAGYGLNWLLRRMALRLAAKDRALQKPATLPIYVVSVLCAGLILFEHLAVPIPLSDARIPAVYAQIAADPRPVSVLQIPLGWRNSFTAWGPEQTQLQYFQTAFAKPMLGGNISRAPDFKLDYFKRIPYFTALTATEAGEPVAPELLAAARAQAKDLIYLYNVGYVLLYPPIPQRFPYVDHWQAAWAFVKETLPLEAKPFWSDQGIEAYRVKLPAGSDHFMLDLGVAGAYPYQGEGWDAAASDTIYGETASWATAQMTRFFLPLRQVQPQANYQLSLRVHPFAYPGSPSQRAQLWVNDAPLAEQPVADDWQTLTWQISGRVLLNGLNRFALTWAQTAIPRQVISGARQIGQTGVALPLDAELNGFADGGFIALFDEKGQQIDASAGRRGINVTVLEPKNGAIVQKQGFDTAANVFESEALVAFLASIKPGAPVLVVSKGDASAYLTAAAVTALQGLGADVTLDQLRGQHFALIGVQGAKPGRAAMVIDAQQAFLRIGLNPDRRTLAAAVDWLKLEPIVK